MIPVGTAVGYLTLDYTQFSSNLKTAIGEATSLSGKFSDTLGKGLTTVGNQIAGVGKAMTAGLTVPIGTAAASAVKFGADFDKSMSNVAAVSGATTEEFGKMREAAISWGEKTVYTATEASDALYYMGLAGWGTNESIAGLGPVLNLAAAGDLELGRTSDIVTDAMTSMKLAAGELNKDGIENTIHFTNSLAAAMSNSNTDVDQMGEAFKYVAPLAGALGYDINDLSLALGLMANVGVKGSQAGTGLRQALKNLIAPTDKAQAYMDKFGVSLYDDTGKAKDMRTFMEELRGTFGDLSVDIYDSNGELKSAEQIMEEYGHSLPTTQQEKLNAIVEIFGTRALPGILGIIEQGDDKFTDLADAIDGSDAAFVKYNGDIMPMKEALEKFGDSVYDTTKGFEILGASEGMAQIQMDNLQGDWIRFTSALGTSKIMISDLVKDSLRGFVQKLTELVQWFNSLDDAQKKHILKIAAIIAAIGPLLLVFGKTVAGIGSMITGFQKMSQAFNLIQTGFVMFGTKLKNVGEAFKLAKAGFTGFASQTSMLGTALAGVTAPMIAIVVVIAVLVAMFVHLWKTNEDFRNKITGIWDGIVSKFKEAGQKITDAINSLGFDFSDLGEVMYAAWDWICNVLAPILSEMFATIGRLLGGVVDIIVGVVQVICGIIKGFKDGDWSLFIEGLKSIWDGFWAIASAPFVAVYNILTEYLAKLGLTWSDVWNGIKDFFFGIWEAIKTFISNVLNGIKNFFVGIINGIYNAWVSVWTAVSTFINTILTNIQTFFTNVWNAIKNFVCNTWDSIKTKILTTFENIKNFIQTTLQTIQTIKQTIWTAIKNFIANTWDAIKTKISTTFEAIKTFITTTLQAIQTTIHNIWNAIKTFVINTVEAIKTQVSQKFEALKSAVVQTISNMASSIINKVKEIYNGIVNTFSDIKSKMEEVGSNIVNGIWNGISNGWDWLKNKVADLAKSLLDAAKDALGIKSPSKEFEKQVGVWLPPGIANGFAKALPAAMADMESELDDGLSEFDVRDIDIVGLSNSFMTVVTEVTDWFTSIEERLAQTVDAVKADIANLIGVGQLVLNSDGTISGLVMNRPSDSLEVSTPGRGNNSGNGGETINNFTFYSNESIDEIQAAKLLKETQRDLAEGF
jgi:TP901 family phage tail tape measure protein